MDADDRLELTLLAGTWLGVFIGLVVLFVGIADQSVLTIIAGSLALVTNAFNLVWLFKTFAWKDVKELIQFAKMLGGIK